MNYKNWTITTHQANEGFLAVLIDPQGKKLDRPRVCLPSPESAEHYAQKFINWYVKLEERRLMAERSARATAGRTSEHPARPFKSAPVV
ncbi:MAG: hypothetical protein H7Y22_15845 [Gemmatimonadaceae bacterium]|nr:hypothetical protein [Gloeobacterales cyanobacterium ES-bin-141]